MGTDGGASGFGKTARRNARIQKRNLTPFPWVIWLSSATAPAVAMILFALFIGEPLPPDRFWGFIIVCVILTVFMSPMMIKGAGEQQAWSRYRKLKKMRAKRR